MMLFLHGDDKKEMMGRFNWLDSSRGYALESDPASKSAVAQ